MKIIIDTQIFIWTISHPERLSKNTIDLLQENDIFLSQISLMEIAIKQRIGKLPELTIEIEELIEQLIKDNFQILPIKNEHIAAYNKIPLFEYHRDPFDRLLIATSFSEKIPLISSDKNLELYKDLVEIISN